MFMQESPYSISGAEAASTPKLSPVNKDSVTKALFCDDDAKVMLHFPLSYFPLLMFLC